MILEDLGISYEILEASDRIGGRIYTHRFNGENGKNAPVNDPARYDYFDVGAMRYPCIPWMDRVFDLFKRINIDDLLVEYKLSDDKNQMYFNNRRKSAAAASEVGDPFKVSVSQGGEVPDSFADPKDAVDHWVSKVYGGFKAEFAAVYKLPKEDRPAAFQKAWASLTKHDYQSTRSYMSNEAKYPEPVIEWLEMFDAATGLYNQGFVESVIDSLDFDWPYPLNCPRTFKQPDSIEEKGPHWQCIDGGSDHIIDAMLKKIKSKPLTGRRATRIAEARDQNGGIIVEWASQTGRSTSTYSQVICTAPLGCVAAMDLKDAKLLYGQKVAIRSLHYDASTKVGLKFATRWWEDPKIMGDNTFQGGQSKTDLPIRVCVYPSYGINVPPENPPPGIMIASYTWAQDALRIGSLSQSSDPEADAVLLETVLDNIADLHGIPRSELPECLDHYAHGWYNERNSRGAFALFGPGQFGEWSTGVSTGKRDEETSDPRSGKPVSLFASIKAPAANGKLHFAGEATSIHHAWVLGSLNSAWRAIYNMLAGQDKIRETLTNNWGIPDEETEISLKLLLGVAQEGRL